MIATKKTDEQLFEEVVEMLYEQHQDEPTCTKWELYENLKKMLTGFDLDYDKGIQIIKDGIEV